MNTHRILFLIVMILLSNASRSFGQNTINSLICTEIEFFVVGNQINRSKSIENTGNVLYLCVDGLPINFDADSLKISNYTVIRFSMQGLDNYDKNYRRKLKCGVPTLFVSKELINDMLSITVTERIVKVVSKNKVSLALCTWQKSDYEYSCARKEWVFVNRFFHGI